MDVAALLARLGAIPKQARVAASVCAAFVMLLVIAGGVLAHPQRTALFATPLHPEQLSEVEERLASWNVPFTPSPDNVLVDLKRRNDVLLRLSLAGVPHQHVDASNDVLGKIGALTPQSVIEAQTRDGLAGDIELAMRGIDGVQDARVIIAPAKPGYFADDSSHDATASVRMQMSPGAHLSPDAVAGLRAFVAAAVPGLTARNVTIVDDRGVALGGDSLQGDASDLQRSLQSALDAALGAGSTIVRVHVDYDRRSIASHDVRRVPVSSVPISANVQDERYTGSGKQYARSEQQLDRGSDTRETTASVQSGRVARISAAIFVDATHLSDLAQVRSLASATLGIDPRRGDALEVQAIPFSRAPAAKKDGWWLAYGALTALLPPLVLAGAVLVAIRWAWPPAIQALRVIGERAAIAKTAETVRGIAPARVRGALLNEPPHAAAAIISALPAATAAAVLDLYPEHERSAIIRRMQRPASPLLADAEKFIERA